MIKQFIHSRLAIRIFLITTLLITLTTLTIHSLFNLFLPGFYYQYKEKQMTTQISVVLERVEGLGLEQAINVIDNFAVETGMQMIIADESNQVIFVPNMLTQYQIGTEIIPKFYLTPQSLTSTNDYLVVKHAFQPINVASPINLIVRIPLQPIDEASQAINSFLPYLLLIIIFVALIAAFIFTRMIAKPLLRLNVAASKMAELDFTADLPIEANDEIGEIARSLAELAHNLDYTMTKLQSANQQLLDDIEKERIIEKQRREFIATVSHELKTPLTAILGRLEGMIYNIGAFSDRDKYLQQTYDVAKQMEQLVYEIVAVSKLESEAFKPKHERLSVAKVTKSCVSENSYLAQEKSQQINLLIETELETASDIQLLRKAIINLIRNAIYYSPSQAEITVHVKQEGEFISLIIRNTGVTMTREQIQYVLQPFNRLEQSRNRQTGGSGLGLYIVSQIAKRCGYQFNLSSDETYVEAKLLIKVAN
ncbi:MAG: sensor histidine kinase [Culicoidibacterales bacterium]